MNCRDFDLCYAKYLLCILLLHASACRQNQKVPTPSEIKAINLKEGQLIACGPADQQFGKTDFDISCNDKNKKDFNLGIALLHSFEYDEAEKVFSKIIANDPTCAMAYWGVAMSNFHPLWTPPSAAELEKGFKAIQIAKSLQAKQERERDYIAAVAAFYEKYQTLDHITRALSFEKGMQNVYEKNPSDKEAAIFYSLALIAAANPNDTSYLKQNKAGEILNTVYAAQPDHPGIVHYLIHCYDYPSLAEKALTVARRYAAIAPSSAHALHMPSHIFTRLGLWQECIQSNIASTISAKCYAEASGIKGHWDEELHGMDYIMYGYLQQGKNDSAMSQWNYLKTITTTYPENFKVAYAFAAMPSRYVLENKLWKEASELSIRQTSFPWQKFPWQKAIVHFTRALGQLHSKQFDKAALELAALNTLHDTLIARKVMYEAKQVKVQIKTVEAWTAFEQGKKVEGEALMKAAADMEDGMEKHPVTPGEVIPARELLGDMLMESNKAADALNAYKIDLQRHAKRFNGLYGAATAAEKSGDKDAARDYFRQLLEVSSKAPTQRTEIKKAETFLQRS